MLPGFRFLFAAIVLSMSVLVFGLGAAALLRAAHEEVASSSACGARCPNRNLPSQARRQGKPWGTRPARAGDAAGRTGAGAAAGHGEHSGGRGAGRATGDRAGAGCSPRKSPRWRRRIQPRPRPRSLKSRSRNHRCKASADAGRCARPCRRTKDRGSRAGRWRRRTKQLRPHPNRRARRLRRTPVSPRPGSPHWAVRPLRSRRSRPPSRRQDLAAKPDQSVAKERLQARRAAERRRIALRARQAGSTTGRRSVRADHAPAAAEVLVSFARILTAKPVSTFAEYALSGRAGRDRRAVGQAPFGPRAVIQR